MGEEVRSGQVQVPEVNIEYKMVLVSLCNFRVDRVRMNPVEVRLQNCSLPKVDIV